MTRLDAIFGLFAMLILWGLVAACCAGCTNATGDCERVREAINARAVECAAGFDIRGPCDGANYVDGDVEACLAAIKGASCEDLRQVARDKCIGLFGHAGL